MGKFKVPNSAIMRGFSWQALL